MNTRLNTLISVIAVSSLVACSDQSSLDQSPQTSAANFANDASTIDSGASVSLAGFPDTGTANDLTISDVALTGSFDAASTVSYQFAITENGGSAVPVDQLSVALEIAASGSFADAYRISLFDLRAEGAQLSSSELLSARSAPVDLPGGAYTARLVVNPNWQYSFDTVPADHKHSGAYRYMVENDYRNNASSTFQIQVANNLVCAEDGFEDNDDIQSAQPIPVGGQIDASLCLDNIDIYSVDLADDEIASLSFDYTDAQSNQNPATRYVILDGELKALTTPRVAREASNIVIEATNSGTYHLAFFGQRSSYQLNRSSDGGTAGLAYDFIDTNLFASGSITGPNSWLLGGITLQKLAFTEEKLSNQIVNCGRITTQYSGDYPVAYVTPSHFADIYEFRFLPNGTYLIDAEQENGWTVNNGDISNADWYTNDYPGYAERVSDNIWRYWSTDGLAYVECTLERNQ